MPKQHNPLRELITMANDDGTFGFDELEKAFKKTSEKFPDETDAMLMAMARTASSKVKSRTPVGKTKKLKGSWRVKKVKKYGQARVARVQSESRYAHLVEEGHEVVTGGKGTVNGRKLNVVQRGIRGVKSGGKTRAAKMLESTMKDLESSFGKSAEDLLEKLTREVEL